mmetsp:Transcript_9848/g.24945  ORF Transcript_9848/g.24945 Transcript_9848/m.24945 type:complete len:212 (+) Transcript_9848:1109-1744(+)
MVPRVRRHVQRKRHTHLAQTLIVHLARPAKLHLADALEAKAAATREELEFLPKPVLRSHAATLEYAVRYAVRGRLGSHRLLEARIHEPLADVQRRFGARSDDEQSGAGHEPSCNFLHDGCVVACIRRQQHVRAHAEVRAWIHATQRGPREVLDAALHVRPPVRADERLHHIHELWADVDGNDAVKCRREAMQVASRSRAKVERNRLRLGAC